MAVLSHDDSEEKPLEGECIALVGRLASMTRREAAQLIVARGADLATELSSSATLVVIGDSHPDLATALACDKSASRQLLDDVADGRAMLLRESELWQRIGLIDKEQGVQRLYTPAMLAELLNIPAAAVRRWHRNGVLTACRNVRRLPYFDFTEVAVARHLAELFRAGCSLRVIDRQLAELDRVMPDVARPLADPAVVVEGRRLFMRRGDDLTEPGGQVLIDFDRPTEAVVEESPLISIGHPDLSDKTGSEQQELSTLEQLRQVALDWEDQGELQQAAEAYRTLLVAGGPTAETNFSLADLLYRMGDLPAARERFYATVEFDEEYVEARANLGCVLAENNELELAVAAFQGALAFHPDYADVHYHLANSFDRLNQHAEAELHWHTFLALAPESPWADMARSRLGQAETATSNVSTPVQ